MKSVISALRKSLSVSSKNRFIISICFLFIASGAINNGFSWFLPAIPFAALLFFQLRYCSRKQRTWIVFILLVVIIPLASNHSENSLLYPHLNAKVKFQSGWGYLQYSDSPYYSLVPPENIVLHLKNVKQPPGYYSHPLTQLENSSPMHLVKIHVSHPDFGTQLRPIFKDESGCLFSISDSYLIEGITNGTIESMDLKGVKNLQSSWSMYIGNLMMWPAIPFLVQSLIQSIFI